MKIYVRSSSGHFIPLVANVDQDVRSLKATIQQQEHISTECQRLIFRGRQLEDCASLSASKLIAGCTIFLHTRAKGGMQGGAAAASSQQKTLRHDTTTRREAAALEAKNKETLAAASFRHKVWIILSEPTVCKEAKWMFNMINVSILVSFVSITLSTLPDLQTEGAQTTFFIVNTLLIVIFVVDFVLRLLCAPDIKEFLQDGMTWVDFVSTFSYFPALIWPDSRILGFLRVMRTLRHIRFFRPRPTFVILTTLTHDLKQATSALIAPMYFMLLVLILLGAMEYFAENNHQLEVGQSLSVESIPTGLWWGIVTMSGVGYGDASPNSIPGKLVAAFTAFVGVFFIAMPFAVSGGSFWHALSVYRQQMEPSYEELSLQDDFNEEEYFGFQTKKNIKLIKAMYAWMDPVAKLDTVFKEITQENKPRAIQKFHDEIQNIYNLQEKFESQLLDNMSTIMEDESSNAQREEITSVGDQKKEIVSSLYDREPFDRAL